MPPKNQKTRRIYKFNNVLFEDSDAGPWPLNEDYSSMKQCPKNFTLNIEKWLLSSKKEQEKYRINE